MKDLEKELADVKEEEITTLKNIIEHLEEACNFYKNEAESFWAELAKRRNFNLEMAQRVVKHDSKAIANIILNMYFGKMPSDSCSFCEIFDLKGKGLCGDDKRCTDCIDDFLRAHYQQKG